MPIPDHLLAVAKRFPDRLRELRTEAGVSQKSLAETAGVTQGLLSGYERGEYAPSWDVVVSLAHALGVPIGAFTIAPKQPEKNQDAT